MKVCDVVQNSIWYDPRVRKQIIEYQNNKIDVIPIGRYDDRQNANKLNDLCDNAVIVDIPEKLKGKNKGIISKVIRDFLIQKKTANAIITSKPDIIHANDLDALIPAYIASKQLKCKLIYDSHEVYLENASVLSGGIEKKIYRQYLAFCEKRIIRKIDLLVCVSHAAAEYFKQKYKIHGDKVLVVTNCPHKTTIIRGKRYTEVFEVLNQGRYYEGRGYELLVDALPQIIGDKNIKFAVRGYGELEQKLRENVLKCSNSNQFTFYDPVPTEELVQAASKSNVGIAITLPVCLNFKLSVSNKIFEYAAAGIPVIMSNIPEHRYLNEKYNFGVILDEITPQKLVETVRKLYNDKTYYDELANNAVKMIESLNWETEFSKLLSREWELLPIDDK